MGLLLPRGVAERLLRPRGGLGEGAGVAAGRRGPEPAPREAAAVARRVAAPVRPRSRSVRRRVVRTPVPVPRGRRPRSASARGTPEAAPAAPIPYSRAGVRRSRRSKILSVHDGTRSRAFPPETAPVEPPPPKQLSSGHPRRAALWFRPSKVPPALEVTEPGSGLNGGRTRR